MGLSGEERTLEVLPGVLVLGPPVGVDLPLLVEVVVTCVTLRVIRVAMILKKSQHRKTQQNFTQDTSTDSDHSLLAATTVPTL